MKQLLWLLGWWLGLVAVWFVYRSLPIESELFSEVVAKPIVWLGSVYIGLRLRIIPASVFRTLKSEFLRSKPWWLIFAVPFFGIVGYFFLINSRSIVVPDFSAVVVATVMMINVMTGFVEEFVYRGVLFLWLRQMFGEYAAFGMVQLLFVMAHLPVLYVRAVSLEAALVQLFFVMLIGTIHTVVFRATKSLYASTVTHGAWNTLVHIFLVGI